MSPSEVVTGSLVLGRYRVVAREAATSGQTLYIAKTLSEEERLVGLVRLSGATPNVNLHATGQQHLAPVVDVGVENGAWWVARDFRPSRSLSQIKAAYWRELRDFLPPDLAAWIVASSGRAGLGLREVAVDADINLDAIRITFDGELELRQALAPQLASVERRAYLAPELDTGTGADAEASDVFALGVCLFGLLCDVLPFSGGSVREVRESMRLGPMATPRVVNPHVPRELDALCMAALHKNPSRRPKDVATFVDALEASALSMLAEFDEHVDVPAAECSTAVVPGVARAPARDLMRVRLKGLMELLFDGTAPYPTPPARKAPTEARRTAIVERAAIPNSPKGPPEGRHLLFGRYLPLQTLGGGGGGDVYRALDQLEQREVALKIVDFGAGALSEPRRFAHEVRALAALPTHPNLVRILGHGTEGDRGYIAMEVAKGRSLHAVLRDGRVPWRLTLRWLLGLAEGLSVLHDAGLLHRDIKPQNIVVDGTRAVIIDLGIAQDLKSSTKLTHAGMVVGTTEYTAPERFADGNVDERADLYSLGCVWFELLTGERLFRARGPAVMVAHLREAPRRPSEVVRDVPAFLDAAVLQLLEKKPERRFPSAEALRQTLWRLEVAERHNEPSA